MEIGPNPARRERAAGPDRRYVTRKERAYAEWLAARGGLSIEDAAARAIRPRPRPFEPPAIVVERRDNLLKFEPRPPPVVDRYLAKYDRTYGESSS